MPDLKKPPFRLDEALEQAGDEALLAELVGIALAECPKYLDAARIAQDGADARGLEFAAHTFRGAVTVLGAGRLREALYEVEDLARCGSVSACVEPMSIARVEWSRMADELGAWLAAFRSKTRA